MDKRSALLIVVFLAIFGLALFLAWRVGGGEFTADSKPKTPVKKFRAAPGTMRENARAIVSDVPSEPTENAEPAGARGDVQTWSEPEKPSVTEQVKEEVANLVDEALHARSLSEGVANIRNNLDQLKTPEGRSHLYTSLGTLYARDGAVDEMQDAFEMAARTSLSEAERMEATYRHVKALLDMDRPREALRVIEETRLDDAAISARALQIRMVEGIAREELGEIATAAATFEEVIDLAKQGKRIGRPDLDSVYRQAALRAHRAYQAMGDKAGLIRVRRSLDAD